MKEIDTYKYSGDEVLDVMSSKAIKRNKWIIETIIKKFELYNLKKDVVLLEFGAGKGEFISKLSGQKYIQTYCIEIDDDYFNQLSKDHKVFKTIGEIGEAVDFIYTIDTLEHIENDCAILKSMFNILKPGGKLLIYVPARPELYSIFDKNIGHIRRYKKAELKNKIRNAGFVIDDIRYSDFLGYFAGLYNKMTSSGKLNPEMVSIYDTFLIPVTKTIEKIVKPFIGKNVIAFCHKKEN